MRQYLRNLSVLIFSFLFCLLIGELLAHAEDSGVLYVQSPGHQFDTKGLTAMGIKVKEGEPKPWYVMKVRELPRIFAAGQMTKEAESWDHYDRDLFLNELALRGAKGVASEYHQFKEVQLVAAEKELRKVMAE